MQISKVSQASYKNLAFGHYLDDEKSMLQRRISLLDSLTNQFNKEKDNERSRYQQKDNNLRSKIGVVNGDLRSARFKADLLRTKLNNVKKDISEERSIVLQLERKIDENNTTITNLQEKQKNKRTSNISRGQYLSNKLSNRLSAKKEQLQNAYLLEYSNAIDGIKNNFIKDVINPVIDSFKEEKEPIPSSVFIHNEIEDDKEKRSVELIFLEWVARLTDSNFAGVDLKKTQDLDSLFKLIKEIMYLSAKEYESTGQHSFTMITNAEDLNLDNAKEENINAFKKLLKDSAELYHNTIIIVSKNMIDKTKISLEIGKQYLIDKVFVENEKFGLRSILKNISERQLVGRNLLRK